MSATDEKIPTHVMSVASIPQIEQKIGYFDVNSSLHEIQQNLTPGMHHYFQS